MQKGEVEKCALPRGLSVEKGEEEKKRRKEEKKRRKEERGKEEKKKRRRRERTKKNYAKLRMVDGLCLWWHLVYVMHFVDIPIVAYIGGPKATFVQREYSSVM